MVADVFAGVFFLFLGGRARHEGLRRQLALVVRPPVAPRGVLAV